MKNAKRRRPITDSLRLPAEILPQMPKLCLSGGSQALIENHGGLKSYSRDCVEVRGKDLLMQIRGEDLELAAMTKTELVIRGIIVSVELC